MFKYEAGGQYPINYILNCNTIMYSIEDYMHAITMWINVVDSKAPSQFPQLAPKMSVNVKSLFIFLLMNKTRSK